MSSNRVDFEVLKGMTLAKIDAEQEKIVFTTMGGDYFTMYHDRECCESVYVESIVGDLNDLIGHPILLAEMSESEQRPADVPASECDDDSETWTFYKLATIKGYVDIRWHGSSNGWYSESVDFVLGDELKYE